MNAVNAAGSTALHIACLWGREACARLLLQHGADVSAVNETGDKALHLACVRGRHDIGAVACEWDN